MSVRDDILAFLRDPACFANGGLAEGDAQVWLSGLTDFAEVVLAQPGQRELRPAQRAAWVGLANLRAGLILGPPGTGKTHLLAWLASGYLWACRRANRPCRVLITGFTRESMANLLDALTPILTEHVQHAPCGFLGNAPATELDPRVRALSLSGKKNQAAAWDWLMGSHLVAAGTNWSIEKLMRFAAGKGSDGQTAPLFHLVLIEEASQLIVSQGLMSLSGLAAGGRVIVAGDDRQLAPVRPTFETSTGPALGGSMYAFLKAGSVPEFPLDETFRLNAPLAEFPREHIYESNYRSAVPERRLRLRDDWRDGLTDWQRIVIDPDNSIVVVLHDGPACGTENPFERHQIRSLVALLSRRMLPAGQAAALWSERLAVVTPHRAQNAALRDELRPLGLGEPYVETVDRIQGRERDAIIAGYCVSDPEFAASLAEFLFSAKRLNVMVTRARMKLILFVSRRLMEIVPPDDDVFHDAWLLREYVYECELAAAVELDGPDGRRHVAEIRVRRFAGTPPIADVDTQTPPPIPPTGRVVQIRYEDLTLDDEQVMRELDLTGRPYDYLVATSAMAHERKDLTPSHQDSKLKFDDVLHKKLQRPVLKRHQQQLALRRGIEQGIADRQIKQQVLHDVFAWLDALAEMAERGHDLTGGIDEKLRSQFVSRNALDIIGKLQMAQRDQELRISSTARSYEYAAREFLAGEFDAQADVVMEGFTFLTPLQQLFVQRCLDRGRSVYFIYPFVPDQSRGFAVMEQTYGPFADRSSIRQLPLRITPPATNLSHLRRALFADTLTAVPSRDDTVDIKSFPHRHAEVAACVERIAQYLATGQYKPHDIAIVARNPAELHALLQEQIRLQLTTGQTPIELRLKIPPRMLLLTPVGRFALTLYELRRNDQFEMTADQFETLIASGWLGSIVQDTTAAFNAARVQFFNLCRTQQDWRAAFQRLESIQADTTSRLPDRLVNEAVLRHWRNAATTVRDLCRRLFEVPEQSIGECVRQLLSELSALDPNLRQAEREIIERIREAMTELTETDGLTVTANEFGDLLNGLVKEYQQISQAGEETRETGRVNVTTPEGIDCSPVAVVFYLAVDDQRVPQPAPQPWPLWELDLDRNQNKERYLFLAVVRAARERLHLSYARMGEGNTYRPSPYLDEAARVLGIEFGPTPPLPPPDAPARPATATLPILGDKYLLHEAAEFTLCPYRYRLEHVDRQARVCRDQFQIVHEAQASWFHAIFENLVGRRATGTEAIRSLLQQAMDRTANDVRGRFPALRELQWESVSAHVRRHLYQQANFLAMKNGNATVMFEKAIKKLGYEIRKDNRIIRVDCTSEHVAIRFSSSVPLFSPVTFREWLLPKVSEDDVDTERTQVGDLQLFSGLYHAVRWWQDATRAAYNLDAKPNVAERQIQYSQWEAKIARDIDQLESNCFPKNPGGHCRVCPVRGFCLGIVEDSA